MFVWLSERCHYDVMHLANLEIAGNLCNVVTLGPTFMTTINIRVAVHVLQRSSNVYIGSHKVVFTGEVAAT